MSLIRRASVRHFLRHPWQLGLAVVGIALGVAVLVSIHLASDSALAAFRLSTEAVTGRATHHVVAGSLGVDEELYRRLRVEHGIRDSAPVLEGLVYPVAQPNRVFRLLGADPFAERGFRSYVGADAAQAQSTFGDSRFDVLMREPAAVLVSASGAAALGLGAGDRFEVEAAGRRQELFIAGLLEDGGELVGDLIVADIASAQEILDRRGRLSRIDLRVAEGAVDDALLTAIEDLLPPGVELEPVTARGDTAQQMTRAFRLNLQALSLLAPLCGCFLIYNTISFAVLQRRPLFGTLRALGTTGREIAALILGEALVIGVLGTAVGLWAGTLLSRVLLAQVTQTISDLYFLLTVQGIELEAGTLVQGAALGIGGALLAAVVPAAEALSATPRTALDRSELESRVRRLLPLVTTGGLLFAVGGVALLWLSTGLLAAFVGLFGLVFGLALLTPGATIVLMGVLTPVAGLLFGQLGRMAARGTVAALSRTGVAVAALVIAVSVAVGVDLMIRSFRSTVVTWLDYTLPSDLYLSPGSASSAADGFDAGLAERVRGVEGVAEINTVRAATISLRGAPVRLMAYDLTEHGQGAFGFADPAAARRWPEVERGEAVFVSEPLAYHLSLGTGSTLALESPRGARSFEVAGIYYDYASDRGAVLVDADLYRELWGDDRITALSVRAAPGTDLGRLTDGVRGALAGERLFNLRSNRALRSASLEVFDRTFLVTGVLRLVAVIVAFVGILGALTALQLERGRELGVLRACGLTPGELWRLVLSQTGLMGLTAGLLSVPVGIAMAYVMIHVINRRSFGWTLELQLAPESLLSAVVIALTAALLAGLFPAFRMARTTPARALRDE